MKFVSSSINSLVLFMVILAGTANAVPPRVSNVYVPLQGEVVLSNGDTVFLSGQVHVLSRVTFSDAFVPTVNLYINLIGVRGTSATTGNTYLVVGATNVEWVGTNPGPPNIPDQTFSFGLVQTSPGPPDTPPSPILPVYLRDFVYAQEAGSEGSLQGVIASFSAN
jgi:hypothetical protein